jgi:hypothetical protein
MTANIEALLFVGFATGYATNFVGFLSDNGVNILLD